MLFTNDEDLEHLDVIARMKLMNEHILYVNGSDKVTSKLMRASLYLNTSQRRI